MAPAALPAPPPLATPAAQAAAAASVLVVAAAASSPTPARSATDPTSTSSPPQPPHVSKLLVPASEITVLRDKKIGEGSFGVVHQGLLRGTIPVAVKSLKGEADDKVMQAFFREVGTWEGLVQRNVLPLMAYSADPPMMVTDYVPDGNLRKYLSARSWPRDAGLRLLLDVARGMVYLHGLGILHGDLKSLNVLVDGGKSLIADFGLSRVRSEVGRSTAGTVGGHVSGTPGFLAPEMVAGHPLGKPADVYAFAMVCYEVLSGGKYPFEDLGNPAVLYNAAVLGTRPPRPEGVPDALWGLVVRCWDQDPGKRPAFATVAEELGKIVGATGPV
ncbi:kinase-like domain-containing protein [Hyaloraphidium curvatum]|nr:kinase-like domain-containing protein [Hyaloraphidium curvatum]